MRFLDVDDLMKQVMTQMGWLVCCFALLMAVPSALAEDAMKTRPDATFKFKPGDVLGVEVYQRRGGEVEQLVKGAFTLSGEGHAKIKGHAVKLSGLNFTGALTAIESGVRRDSYVIGLELKAQIVSINKKEVVFIGGRVKNAGHVQVSGEVSVAALVRAAGGLTDDATAGRVRVFHNGVTVVHDVRGKEQAEALMVGRGAILKVARSLVNLDRSMSDRLDELNDAKPGPDRLRDGF